MACRQNLTDYPILKSKLGSKVELMRGLPALLLGVATATS